MAESSELNVTCFSKFEGKIEEGGRPVTDLC